MLKRSMVHRTTWSYLLVGNAFCACKTVHYHRVKLSSSRNLKHRWSLVLLKRTKRCIISRMTDYNLTGLTSDLLDVNELADVHVIIAVANVGPYCLDHLPNHRDDNIPPGQRQRITVEQLLQQCHHVAVVGRAGQESTATDRTEKPQFRHNSTSNTNAEILQTHFWSTILSLICWPKVRSFNSR